MSSQRPKVDLTRIDTAAEFSLGTPHVTEDGSHYRYMQADGAVTAYRLYSYTPGTWQIDAPLDPGTTPADAGVTPACVWDGSSTAITDNYYAWVFVGPGQCTLDFTGAASANDIIYVSGSVAGEVDDAATAALLRGVYPISTVSGAETASCYASIPLYCEDLP